MRPLRSCEPTARFWNEALTPVIFVKLALVEKRLVDVAEVVVELLAMSEDTKACVVVELVAVSAPVVMSSAMREVM
jgi:hypothetical protein